MKTIIIITLTLLTMILLRISSGKAFEKKLKKLKKSRPSLSKEQYVLILTDKGYNAAHINVVYEEIKAFIQIDEIDIYPEDDLHKLYHVEDQDDIEIIENVCNRLNLNLKKANKQLYFNLNTRYKTFNAEYILSICKFLEEKNTCYNNSYR